MTWGAPGPVISPPARGVPLLVVAELCRRPAPSACVTGLMDLGRGTAFAIESREMADLHGEMAERLHGLVQQKDDRPLRLHITIQNKVTPAEARALQGELAPGFRPRAFRFHGLGLYGWAGELWQQLRVYPFRGRA